jgi:SAM-dependent methyltransferase
VLDIGCGIGLLGAYLKKKHNCIVTGLEIIEDNYEVALSELDEVFLGDIETMDLSELGCDYDYIIFSDSLEHLLNPDKVLEKIKKLLSESGMVLISMPNVRNFRVTMPLIFSDSWEYQDEGLLDRTHLRFFTCTSLLNTLNNHGYCVNKIKYDLPLSSKVGLLNKLTFGLLKKHLTSHYFVESCLIKS